MKGAFAQEIQTVDGKPVSALIPVSRKRHTDRDPLFEPIKAAVLEESMNKHKWDNKATDYLV